MKKQDQKFQINDVIKNARNNFQRIIREVMYTEKDGTLEDRYPYSDEELDTSLKPTGEFKKEISSECSQNHLANWQRG